MALNIPTGIPLRYDLDDDFRPVTVGGQYLDPDAASAAIEAVKNQGRGLPATPVRPCDDAPPQRT